ncbi:hypothetical protein K1719_043721 [Acacia pycnantha]|nr:hypothetical protein K1719_043721 [Acacia pycnantha]
MEKDAKVEETVDSKKVLTANCRPEKGKYALLRDTEDYQQGLYDKPLPFYGCGIGWFSFLSGFLCPIMWFYGTILYFQKHYRKDPRERAGLGAAAIARMYSSVIVGSAYLRSG